MKNNIQTIKNLQTQIKGLEVDLRAFEVECEELVNAICEWMARNHKPYTIIGYVGASIEVYSDGNYHWNGLLCRNTLDKVEEKFITYLEEERATLKMRF